MVKLKNHIEINKSRIMVFDFLSDFKNIPLWNYYVKDVKQVSSHVNSKKQYRQIRQNDSQTFEIIEQHFPERILIETIGESNIRFKRSFNLSEDHLGNCILEDYFDIDLGYSNILQVILTSKMKKAVKENLNKLKELLENGDTILQDGRVSRLVLDN